MKERRVEEPGALSAWSGDHSDAGLDYGSAKLQIPPLRIIQLLDHTVVQGERRFALEVLPVNSGSRSIKPAPAEEDIVVIDFDMGICRATGIGDPFPVIDLLYAVRNAGAGIKH